MLRAERVGHGYRTLEDRDLYKELLAQDMHFEVRDRPPLNLSDSMFYQAITAIKLSGAQVKNVDIC